MRLQPTLRNAVLTTLGILVLAAIDIASNARPVAWSDGALAFAGALPVVALALVAFVPSRRLA